ELAAFAALLNLEGTRVLETDLLGEHRQLLAVTCETASLRLTVGVGRQPPAAPFTPAGLRRPARPGPAAPPLGTLSATCAEHERRELVARTLRKVTESACVVDVGNRKIAWMVDTASGQPCARDLLVHEESFLGAIEQEHRAGSNGEGLVGRNIG